jgi:hypothetical protein
MLLLSKPQKEQHCFLHQHTVFASSDQYMYWACEYCVVDSRLVTNECVRCSGVAFVRHEGIAHPAYAYLYFSRINKPKHKGLMCGILSCCEW